MQLNKLAKLCSGYQFRGRIEADPQGNVAVLQVRDLEEGAIVDPARLVRVKLDRSPEAYQVSEGDVIFLSRGNRLFATAITIPLENAIVPGYFFIVRPDRQRVLPAYLAWYINQKPAQDALRQYHAGTHMPMVPMAAFRALEIEVPPLDVQRAIAELAGLARREQQLLSELQEARQQLVQGLCLEALSHSESKRKVP